MRERDFTNAELEQMEKVRKLLQCSAQEAINIVLTDKAIDHGEKMEFDLTPEQKKNASLYTRTGTRKVPTAYKFDKRERKKNNLKINLINALFEFVAALEDVSAAQITNEERQIAFNCGNERFELTLVQKRKQKGA